MKFNEKLDLLMAMTKTTNSSLAKYTSLDPSYISRLRRGERKPAKNASYLKAIAIYFAMQKKHTALQSVLSKELGFEVSQEQGIDQLTDRLYQWFLDEKGFTFFENGSGDEYPDPPQNGTKKISMYYGNQGKREGVLSFLSTILEKNKPTTLYLYSDEAMDWMIEDQRFMVIWKEKLVELIKKGYRIRIIHTVNRNLNEMIEALANWIPLYMTGSIEPLYYSKRRDEIFKRTLFIAPGIAAFTANCVENNGEQTLNLLIKDQKAIEALLVEFNDYAALCKPLITLFETNTSNDLERMIEGFRLEKANMILYIHQLQLHHMSDEIMKEIIQQINDPMEKESFVEKVSQQKQWFYQHLEQHQMHEIINVSMMLKMMSDPSFLENSKLSFVQKQMYHPLIIKKLFQEIIKDYQKYPNYHVTLIQKPSKQPYDMYVKEEIGSIIVSVGHPIRCFTLKESNLTAALWDYLNHEISQDNKNKDQTLKEMEKFIEEL